MTTSTVELKAILDSFLPYVCAVLNDATSDDNEGFESLRKRSFSWEGVPFTATTSAKRDGAHGDCQLLVQFEHNGDREFRLFTEYPELFTVLMETLRKGDSNHQWKLEDATGRLDGYKGDNFATLHVSRLP